MPLQKGSSQKTISNNIRELHSGKTYAHTSSKFGKDRANKQSVAIAFSEAKGRAFGGVAPQMNGMMGQAMNPMMPGTGMPSANPALEPNNNPAMQPMPQMATNGAPMGVNPAAMMGPPTGLNAGVSGPAGARPFAFGGGVAPIAKTFHGPIVSAVPGRTDRHETHVPSGSFVIPADIVSGHGEGNTLAGMNHLQKLFKMGAHAGSNPSKIPGIGSSSVHKLAKGGNPSDKHVGKPVKVILAGGEIVVPPENVHETMQRVCKKNMTLSQCHAAMDQWVINQRKKLVKTLKALPPPARD